MEVLGGKIQFLLLANSLNIICVCGCIDYAYVDSQQPELPYHICVIRDFKMVSHLLVDYSFNLVRILLIYALHFKGLFNGGVN